MRRVYFIKPIGLDGPIKVGCSYSPDTRRRTLETWSPFALEILAEVEGDMALERRFHALFIETHQRREWFGWSKRIATTIEAIKDGSFDVETLPAPICVSGKTRNGKGSRAREWSEPKRFSMAYTMRRRALRKRGMPHEEWMASPDFYSYGVWLGHARGHRPYTAAEIRACEKAAAELTAKYGHDKLKPVLWRGPLPAESAAA